jgi:hypothetical protein
MNLHIERGYRWRYIWPVTCLVSCRRAQPYPSPKHGTGDRTELAVNDDLEVAAVAPEEVSGCVPDGLGAHEVGEFEGDQLQTYR